MKKSYMGQLMLKTMNDGDQGENLDSASVPECHLPTSIASGDEANLAVM